MEISDVGPRKSCHRIFSITISSVLNFSFGFQHPILFIDVTRVLSNRNILSNREAFRMLVELCTGLV